VATLALWVLLSSALVALAFLAVLTYQIIQQQGRILLRLEALEDRGHGGHAMRPADRGQPVGSLLEAFRLSALGGGSLGLDDLRGRRALLVNWGTNCGFCRMIAPDLVRLDEKLARRNTALVLISSGGREANRRLADEFGLNCPILLGGRLELFKNQGTPVAYLIDEQGRVARPVATGANEVLELAEELALDRRRLQTERPLDSSRLARSGLKAGTRAPDFTLPDLAGRSVSLSDFRGRRVLLVFSDPQCGPCSRLAPDLERLHRRNAELEVLMVSRGDLEANRRKAAQYRLTFPVVLQRNWEVSRDYAMFATPVAYLIDERGHLVADVLVGEQILGLVAAAAGDEGHGASEAVREGVEPID
jgi:peroxiredoxin